MKIASFVLCSQVVFDVFTNQCSALNIADAINVAPVKVKNAYNEATRDAKYIMENWTLLACLLADEGEVENEYEARFVLITHEGSVLPPAVTYKFTLQNPTHRVAHQTGLCTFRTEGLYAFGFEIRRSHEQEWSCLSTLNFRIVPIDAPVVELDASQMQRHQGVASQEEARD